MKLFSLKSRQEIFLLIFFLLYFGIFIHPAADDNENSRYDLVFSIVEQGVFNIDQYEDNTQDKAIFNKHYYSDKPVGPAFIGALIYYPLKKIIFPSGISKRVAQFIIRYAVISIPSILTILLLFRILQSRGVPVYKCFITTIFYGCGTSALPYSTVFHGHQLTAFLLLSSYFCMLKMKREPVSLGKGYAFLVGIFAGLSIITEYASLVLVPIIWILGIMENKRVKWVPWSVLGLISAASPQLVYNTVCFGNPWTLAYSYHVLPHRGVGIMGLIAPRWEPLVGVLISPFRGLFYYSPFLIVIVPSIYFYIRGKRDHQLMVSFIVTLVYIMVNVSLVDWEGGACAGPRYLVTVIPFIIICMIPVLKKLNVLFTYIYEILGWTSVFLFTSITLTSINLPLFSKYPLNEITLHHLRNYITLFWNKGMTRLEPWHKPVLVSFMSSFVLLVVMFVYSRWLSTATHKLVPGILIPTISTVILSVISLFPGGLDVTPPSQYLGEYYLAQGKLDFAAWEFNLLIQTQRSTWKTYYMMGEVYRLYNQPEKSLSFYKKTIELSPAYFAPYYKLGLNALNTQNYKEALEYFLKTIDLKPDFPEVYSNAGVAYYGLGKYKNARDMFMEAIKLKPGYSQAWFNLGNLYLYQFKSPTAIKYYEKSIQINPRFEPARKQLELAKKMFMDNNFSQEGNR